MTTTSAVIIKKTKQQEMREQLAQEKKNRISEFLPVNAQPSPNFGNSRFVVQQNPRV